MLSAWGKTRHTDLRRGIHDTWRAGGFTDWAYDAWHEGGQYRGCNGCEPRRLCTQVICDICESGQLCPGRGAGLVQEMPIHNEQVDLCLQQPLIG